MRALTGQQWAVVVQTAVLIPLIRWSLGRRGFMPTTLGLLRRSERVAATADPGRVLAVAEAVDLVVRRRIPGGTCLHRSLALWFLLRRRGIEAALVLGAAPVADGRLPAHSWVEVDSVPVNESAGALGAYGRFPLMLPGLPHTR